MAFCEENAEPVLEQARGLTQVDAFVTLAVAAVQRDLRWKDVPKWRNWQTRMVQVHVPARVWGFESLLRHQKLA